MSSKSAILLLQNIFNRRLLQRNFPETLKLAHKKTDFTTQLMYSVLQTFFKVFKRLMQKIAKLILPTDFLTSFLWGEGEQ